MRGIYSAGRVYMYVGTGGAAGARWGCVDGSCG